MHYFSKLGLPGRWNVSNIGRMVRLPQRIFLKYCLWWGNLEAVDIGLPPLSRPGRGGIRTAIGNGMRYVCFVFIDLQRRGHDPIRRLLFSQPPVIGSQNNSPKELLPKGMSNGFLLEMRFKNYDSMSSIFFFSLIPHLVFTAK